MKLGNKLLKLALATALLLPPSSLWMGGNHAAHAENALDPAPVIVAKGTPNGKKVLFDNTHAQTAGAADWVIDGAFSDYGNALANIGYYVKELRKTTPITYDDLKDYDVFITAEANVPFKTYEQDAMLEYVQNGGSIFFIADHYNADRNKNRWDGSESFNGYRRGAWDNPAKGMNAEEAASPAMKDVKSSDWLGTNFGVRFRYNALGDITANNIVSEEQAFGITKGVKGVAMHAGSTMAILDPKKAKGIVYLPNTSTKWANAVDQGVYNGGGIAEGPFVSVSKVGAGKAAFIGDSSPVEDATPKYKREETGATKTTYDGFKEVDDGVLLVNLVNWLSTKESYTSFDQVDGLQLDQPTQLLAIENPQTSTEPQSEPWAAPSAGYKWYDPTTYKAGSYGYAGGSTGGGSPGGGTTDPGAGAGISMTHLATLTAGQTFQVTVKATSLTPNSTVTLQLGTYITGGTQVGRVQKDDGTWPTDYNYHSFNVTADAKGEATKVLTVQINSTAPAGSATMRLRKDKSTVYQEDSVTIQ